jgi:hypothetical protein
MKAMYPLLCIAAVAGCDDNKHPLNGSITSALKPGMTNSRWLRSATIGCQTGS